MRFLGLGLWVLLQIDEVRDQVLAFFNAPPGEYHVIFTRGATASLKLVGETFPWTQESEFVYLVRRPAAPCEM